MGIDWKRAEARLREFDFAGLFNELGWDRPSSRRAENVLGDHALYSLTPVAEKRGVRIFHCASIPDRAERQRVDREITKVAYEHLIIFTDPAQTRQIWQWVSRQKGRPAAFREHLWLVASAPDALLQKLDHISFGLDEEQGLTLAGTNLRLRDAFDRERITKRFYGAFEAKHKEFLGFIQGLESTSDRQWYASLMLNRLMFIYFIQKKKFLDDDANYLRERLKRVREERGEGQFHSFYRLFLRTLFHGGLATPLDARDVETRKLLGNVPYLNGGLFEPHALEAEGNAIDIADEAFDAIFKFFDDYDWTLDTRPISRNDGKEINPDVLGHIFEKYINNKQMGAYYTKEDITDYITRNTVVPWLFQTAEAHDRVAFEPSGPIWRMVAENPDAYIYSSVRTGVLLPLPDAIAAGLTDASARGEWNRVADAGFGLATETWREVIARRAHYEEVKAKVSSGTVVSIHDFITLNLDISQFALDVIQYAESSDLVRAFWKGISSIKVLDPACGSGAFLFAALNILHSLYEGCLIRMQDFIDASPPSQDGQLSHKAFREELDRVALHPNRDYFIYKSIIIANLYGVDIMDEAVEICKLRLFLKLAAQLETADQIEPLPDIDFNIRAGNSLIGYTSSAEIRRATEAAGFDFDDRAGQIQSTAQGLDAAFRRFREQQTAFGGTVATDSKAALRSRLSVLEDQLDGFLAGDYGVNTGEKQYPAVFAKWKLSHKPFHWLIEFYGILADGGFDAIIGNPPYLETREVDYLPKGLATLESRAVHALFIERSNQLLAADGGMSMILPMSLVSTSRMKPVQAIIEDGRHTWYSNFAWRPARLFDTVNRALTIFISAPAKTPEIHSTGYTKWTAASRDPLVSNIRYIEVPSERPSFWVPKLSSSLELEMLRLMQAQPLTIGHTWGQGGGQIYYRNTGGLYWKVFTTTQPKFFLNGQAGSSSRETKLPLRSGYKPEAIAAVLSSSSFWWWYTIASNLRDLNPADIQSFRVSDDLLRDPEIATAGEEYLLDLELNSVLHTREQKQTGTTQTQSYKIQKSKPIIDRIDHLMAVHFGFRDEHIDYIVNFDIKYRMGADEDDAG